MVIETGHPNLLETVFFSFVLTTGTEHTILLNMRKIVNKGMKRTNSLPFVSCCYNVFALHITLTRSMLNVKQKTKTNYTKKFTNSPEYRYIR